MTLRQKTLLFTGATLVGLVIILFLSSKVIIMGKYMELEEQETRMDVNRALSALSNSINGLSTLAVDYATWDDTYEYIGGGNENYIQSNYIDSNFNHNRINQLLLIDPSGQVVYGKGFDLHAGKQVPVPEGLEHLATNRLMPGHAEPLSSVQGILLLPEGPMLVASQPILKSDGEGPVRGVLVMGRYLDKTEIERLMGITHLSLEFHRYTEHQNLPVTQAASLFVSKEVPSIVQPVNNDLIEGYALINDIYGLPGLLIKVSGPRLIYQQGLASIRYYVFSLVALGLVFAGLFLLYLDRTVLSRLAQLSARVKNIGISNDLSTRVTIAGRDELSSMGEAINGMLGALEQSRAELRASEGRYRNLAKRLQDIIEFLPDATFVIDQHKRIIAWNRAIEEMTGVPKETMVGRGNYAYAVPFYSKPRLTLIDLVEGGNLETEIEYEHVERKGATLFAESYAPALYGGKGAYLWITASSLRDSEGNLTGAITTIRDITDRRLAEEQLKYLSLRDPLTGIYNRAYFEQEMQRLESDRFAPVGIIMCDVDGLKLINDTLGHDHGDALLKAAAGVIKDSFRQGDVVARVGGDEFAVLLPNSDLATVGGASRRIRDGSDRYNSENPGLSLSISTGVAVSGRDGVNMDDLFKEADNNMYRDKLHRSQSARRAIIQNLMSILENSDKHSDHQTERLQHMVTGLAALVGLSDRVIKDLRLLAQFHDIGKVGISEHILIKPDSLTAEEVYEMQLHSEIGHRIAQSAPDLAHIAEWILKHHEWWNGQGYPLGLKGEEIPLESRILAIANAYEAMTSHRPYRKTMTHEDAVKELHKCAGTQFDPQLVKEFIRFMESTELTNTDFL